MTKIKEKIQQNKFHRVLKGQTPIRKVFCVFQDGRLLSGTQSLHRTVESRRFRQLLRFKKA